MGAPSSSGIVPLSIGLLYMFSLTRLDIVAYPVGTVPKSWALLNSTISSSEVMVCHSGGSVLEIPRPIRNMDVSDVTIAMSDGRVPVSFGRFWNRIVADLAMAKFAKLTKEAGSVPDNKGQPVTESTDSEVSMFKLDGRVPERVVDWSCRRVIDVNASRFGSA